MKSPTKSITKHIRTVTVSQIGFHIFFPNWSAAEGPDVASKGLLDSEVSADSILSCPCGMDDTWLSFKAYDPRSDHPKAVRVERSILGRKELSTKSAGDIHSLSQACTSALSCSD